MRAINELTKEERERSKNKRKKTQEEREETKLSPLSTEEVR
jgi:hypothetical protein